MFSSSLLTRYEETIHAGENSPPQLSPKLGRGRFTCRVDDDFSYGRWKNGLFLLTIFKRVTLSMDNTIPKCWGCGKGYLGRTPRKTYVMDNAPAHNSLLSMGDMRDCEFELVDRSSYFPDLTIIISATWKEHLGGDIISVIMTSYLMLMPFYQQEEQTSLNSQCQCNWKEKNPVIH